MLLSIKKLIVLGVLCLSSSSAITLKSSADILDDNSTTETMTETQQWNALMSADDKDMPKGDICNSSEFEYC